MRRRCTRASAPSWPRPGGRSGSTFRKRRCRRRKRKTARRVRPSPACTPSSTGVGESALPNFTTASIPRPENRWFGNNRGAWSNADYDRLADAYNATLDRDQRIQQMAQMTRLISEELPAISLYYDLGIVAYVSAIKGPVPVGPDTSGLATWNIADWEMQ